jgi:hypothetical protein
MNKWMATLECSCPPRSWARERLAPARLKSITGKYGTARPSRAAREGAGDGTGRGTGASRRWARRRRCRRAAGGRRGDQRPPDGPDCARTGLDQRHGLGAQHQVEGRPALSQRILRRRGHIFGSSARPAACPLRARGQGQSDAPGRHRSCDRRGTRRALDQFDARQRQPERRDRPRSGLCRLAAAPGHAGNARQAEAAVVQARQQPVLRRRREPGRRLLPVRGQERVSRKPGATGSRRWRAPPTPT